MSSKSLPLFCLMFFLVVGCGSHRKAILERPWTPADEMLETNKPQEGPVFDAGLEMRIGDEIVPIYFDFDRYNIREDQILNLMGNTQLVSELESKRVILEGHCDERGTQDYNLALGQRRADTIKKFLVRQGVNSDVTTVSMGEEKPVDAGHTEVAYAKNRRGEFH